MLFKCFDFITLIEKIVPKNIKKILDLNVSVYSIDTMSSFEKLGNVNKLRHIRGTPVLNT